MKTLDSVVIRPLSAVVLPRTNSEKLLGIEPLVLTPDDVTSNYAWWRLAEKYRLRGKIDPYLDRADFVSYDTYIKYYLLTLGLLEFAVIFIGGEPDSGKSMFLAWLTRKMHKYFGKTGLMDWLPPEPKYFGNYRNFLDEDMQEKIIDESNRLHRMELETGKKVPQEELEKFILYKAFLSLDEADGYAHKQMQNNYTKALGQTFRRRRHVYCCIAMVMIDVEEFAPVLLNQVTHKVTCFAPGNLPYPDCCSVLIEDVRKGGSGVRKWLWLNPEECLHLWDSHNIPAMTHEQDIHYGRKPKKKKEEDN